VLTPLAVHDILAALAPAAAQLPRIRAAAARVAELRTRPDPVRHPQHPEPLPAPPYDLSVERLTARWVPDGAEVLRDLSFAAPAGARVAIVGPSGSGKSTLAAVLLRFLDPAGGTVRLGGADITRLDADAVRRVVGVCAQDSYVFDSTLAENVRLARPDATDGEVREALGRARLGDWVDGLPGGVHTFVGEHGARLSGGQRQRLALARALLADFPVLVLDEPTEHLDAATAAVITADLLASSPDRTELLITHDPHGIA
jgi:ABC-type multidrug transport system fused ATPase/permease subunit